MTGLIKAFAGILPKVASDVFIAESGPGRIVRPVRRPEALDLPALLVDQHGRIRRACGLPHFTNQRFDLRGIVDIAPEQDETPGALGRDERALVRRERGA